MKAEVAVTPSRDNGLRGWFQTSERWQMFTASPLVVISAIWLTLIVLGAIFGPALIADRANQQDLSLRFLAPFQ